ncbi:hypothetical protein SCHPADRAFT_1000790 [Schizopora paradoxa]|uniref:Uncharacterized protein n=1 Tax=Schizopora paradoxa TaxID=27342 RepID=A0A0H2RV28_9AGAM|nr:hypothetical protein SCHPADRAFT_1000790 [Schizopora paradoxa]
MLPTLVAAPFALLFAAIQQTNINYIAELFIQSNASSTLGVQVTPSIPFFVDYPLPPSLSQYGDADSDCECASSGFNIENISNNPGYSYGSTASYNASFQIFSNMSMELDYISQMPSFAIQGNIDSSYTFSVAILNLGDISSSQTSVVYLGTDFKPVSGQSSGVTVIQNTTAALIDYTVSEISEDSGSQRYVFLLFQQTDTFSLQSTLTYLESATSLDLTQISSTCGWGNPIGANIIWVNPDSEPETTCDTDDDDNSGGSLTIIIGSQSEESATTISESSSSSETTISIVVPGNTWGPSQSSPTESSSPTGSPPISSSSPTGSSPISSSSPSESLPTGGSSPTSDSPTDTQTQSPTTSTVTSTSTLSSTVTLSTTLSTTLTEESTVTTSSILTQQTTLTVSSTLTQEETLTTTAPPLTYTSTVNITTTQIPPASTSTITTTQTQQASTITTTSTAPPSTITSTASPTTVTKTQSPSNYFHSDFHIHFHFHINLNINNATFNQHNHFSVNNHIHIHRYFNTDL